MIVPRAHAVSVVLPDGKVFVTGGVTSAGITALTEVYDPSAKTWSAGPTMNSPRVGHTATLLADGKVLVAGGETPDGTTSSVEIIDVSSGVTAPVASMYFERSGHAAARLDSGKVLVTGGSDWVTAIWKQAELFDPVTRKWSAAGSMANPRFMFAIELLPDGTPMAIGGDSEGTSEKYDPATNKWYGERTMLSKRFGSSSIVLGDSRILVAGGVVDSLPVASAEVFDPGAGTWAATGNMSEPRASFTLSELPNGTVLAAGSSSDLGTTSSAELFDSSTGSWMSAPSMNIPRGAHGSAVLPCGSVMVFGGKTDSGLTASVEIYGEEGEEQAPCMPIDLVPLVMACTELPGHSEDGFYAKLLAAQEDYDAGDIDACLEHMRVFYLHIRAFDHSGHLTDEHVDMLYEGYASVVSCLGGEPLPPLDWR